VGDVEERLVGEGPRDHLPVQEELLDAERLRERRHIGEPAVARAEGQRHPWLGLAGRVARVEPSKPEEGLTGNEVVPGCPRPLRGNARQAQVHEPQFAEAGEAIPKARGVEELAQAHRGPARVDIHPRRGRIIEVAVRPRDPQARQVRLRGSVVAQPHGPEGTHPNERHTHHGRHCDSHHPMIPPHLRFAADGFHYT